MKASSQIERHSQINYIKFKKIRVIRVDKLKSVNLLDKYLLISKLKKNTKI